MPYISKKDIRLPKRKKDGKKGDNGKILVIGGSKDYVGAAALAGLAALRSGADWVTVAAPEKVAWAINSLAPDLVTTKLKGDYFSLKNYKNVFDLLEKHDVVLIGNGMGLKKETRQFLKKIIKKIKIPKVIDADAIKMLSADDLDSSIITPHIRELEIFMKNSGIGNKIIKKIINEKHIQKRALLIKMAFERQSNKKHNRKNNKNTKNKNNLFENNIMLLKGPIAIIMSKDKVYFNNIGSPGMTKAGTGDVIAGLTAGFLGQSKDLLQSSINSSYFSKSISDILLKKKKGFTYLASDMVNDIKKFSKN